MDAKQLQMASSYGIPTTRMRKNLEEGQGSTTSSTSSGSTGSSSQTNTSNFAHKLYQMIEDRENIAMISWARDGKSFTVYDSTEFTQSILPRYFKHSNLSSFVRQLNMYGFHKANRTSRGTANGADAILEFTHPLFERGKPDMLEKIKRNHRDNTSSSCLPGGIHRDCEMRDVVAKLHNTIRILQGTVDENSRHIIRQQEIIDPLYQFFLSHGGYAGISNHMATTMSSPQSKDLGGQAHYHPYAGMLTQHYEHHSFYTNQGMQQREMKANGSGHGNGGGKKADYLPQTIGYAHELLDQDMQHIPTHSMQQQQQQAMQQTVQAQQQQQQIPVQQAQQQAPQQQLVQQAPQQQLVQQQQQAHAHPPSHVHAQSPSQHHGAATHMSPNISAAAFYHYDKPDLLACASSVGNGLTAGGPGSARNGILVGDHDGRFYYATSFATAPKELAQSPQRQ